MKIKQHQEGWRNERIVMQVLYLFPQSFPVHGESRYIYLHIHMAVYVHPMAPVEVSHSPTFEPFCPLNYLAFLSRFPASSTAVPSVERVINRATRWCCNTSWKHYRAPALCAVMQESRRRGPLISTTPATWLRARNLQFLHYRDRGWRNYGAEGYTCHLLGFIKGSNILTITKEELQK